MSERDGAVAADHGEGHRLFAVFGEVFGSGAAAERVEVPAGVSVTSATAPMNIAILLPPL